jgi:tripartite-type tricarboxylate transporter receptor subunit TctC
MAEYLPGYEASIYVGVAAPRGTPGDIVNTLNQHINLALTDPAMLQCIAELGDTPLPLSASEFAKLVATETQKWGGVIRTANVRAE